MRLVVLGGAGDMGKRAVKVLAACPEVMALTVADLNLDRAQDLVRSLAASGHVTAVRVNALDPSDLIQVMQGHDVAASAVGPFYRFEVPVARAAIAAGVDYVSLCDDHDAARAVLALDGEARAAGRRMITGLGWTPGLSNVLAKAGCDTMDRPEAVDVAWCGAAADSRGYAVVLHTLHIFSGQVPTFADRRSQMVTAGTGRLRVDFPHPLGRLSVFHVGHPEPVTLPMFIPGLKRVTLRGGLTEPFLNWLGLAVARLGLTSTPGKRDFIGRIVKTALPLLERVGPKGVPCSGLRVDVTGRRAGKRVRISYAAANHMENLTGIPLAIGALMLGRGQVGRLGVMAPEAPDAVDPGIFLKELSQCGVQVATLETRPHPVHNAR